MSEENIFEKMESKNDSKETQQPVTSSGEVDYEKISEVAVGDKVKYERENLDGQEVTIEKAQLFNADTSDDPISALNDKTKKYYKCNFIVTYDKKNKDGVQHREYYSGAIQFVQKDGSLSPQSLYYEGAKNQVSNLWRLVAEKKGIEPDRMSPREFVGFLNNKPKAVLKYVDVEFNKNITQKNLVEKFI